MQASLPSELIEVFERAVTTEYVTLDARGRPVAWPVTPFLHADEGCIDVTTPLGEPEPADEADRNPHVALLFSDPAGSGLARPPMVLVQGTARVDDRDLRANRERYGRDARTKAPRTWEPPLPEALKRALACYFSRIYVHVRPERIYVWPDADVGVEPTLYDARMEEVRSGHNEEPEVDHAPPEGGGPSWDRRLEELGREHPTAALCVAGPDGFPFAVRVPVRPDRGAGMVRVETEPVGVPLEPGLASLCVHAPASGLRRRRSFQLHGDLVRDARGWGVAPRRVVGASDPPAGTALDRGRAELRAALRFRRTAKVEAHRRTERSG
jgi:hypothetical protein